MVVAMAVAEDVICTVSELESRFQHLPPPPIQRGEVGEEELGHVQALILILVKVLMLMLVLEDLNVDELHERPS